MTPLLIVDSLAPYFGHGGHVETSTSSSPWSHLSFSLSPGDVVLVRGVSGIGKTTLLRTLANLVPAGQGGVLYQGSPPSESPALYRSHVTYVAQRPPLLSGSPLDLWCTVLDFDANRPIRNKGKASASSSIGLSSGSATATAAAYTDVEDGEVERAGTLGSLREAQGPGWRMEELNAGRSSMAAMPDSAPSLQQIPLDPERTAGLLSLPSHLMARDWNTLSGGEAQRAALAVALTLKARWGGQGVLLLDEPTSALDDQTARTVEQLLLASSPPLTLVIITHSDLQSERIVDLAEKTRRRVARLTLGGGGSD